MREQSITLTRGQLRRRAITALSEAVREMEHNRPKDAWMSYGEALTYEYLYNELLYNYPQYNLEYDSLFRHSELFQALCEEWDDLIHG